MTTSPHKIHPWVNMDLDQSQQLVTASLSLRGRGEALGRFRKNNAEKVQKPACGSDVVMLQECKRLMVPDGKPNSIGSFTSCFTHFPSVHTHSCPFLGMILDFYTQPEQVELQTWACSSLSAQPSPIPTSSK